MSKGTLAVGINGASGRMGTRLIQLITEDQSLHLAAALVRADHVHLGDDAGTLAGRAPLGVALAPSIPPRCTIDVMIDFSLPPASLEIAARCAERLIPLVVGTTGFDRDQLASLKANAAKIPLLIAPNMSRAVNLLMKLVGDAARSASGLADMAIVERHHRTKIDAPSGTALRLAEIIRDASTSESETGPGVKSSGDNPARQVDIHALRIGDSPGEHTVIFGFLGETLELSHRAFNRDGFVRGSLEAAKFLAGQPPGLYSMKEVVS